MRQRARGLCSCQFRTTSTLVAGRRRWALRRTTANGVYAIAYQYRWRIAKHDGESALAFFRATELPVDPADSSDNPWRLGERAFELRLANNIAASNPEIALNLARRSLARGFSPDVIPLLRQLNRKHKEQALVLYDEIVTKLKRVNLSTDDMAFDFTASLARSFTRRR
jgi:hypothetical protein